jgi:hypothetical protein
MLLERIVGNPMIVSIIMTLIQNLLTWGNRLASPCLGYIIEASGMDISNEERFNFVLNKMRNDFPDVGSSFLRTVIETTLDAWTSGKLV